MGDITCHISVIGSRITGIRSSPRHNST